MQYDTHDHQTGWVLYEDLGSCLQPDYVPTSDVFM